MRKLALSQAVGQGLLVAITPILTRQYTAADIGLFQVAFAISIIVSLGWTLRADLVIPGHTAGVRVAVSRRLLVLGAAVCAGLALAAWALAAAGQSTAAEILAMVAMLSFSQGLLNLDNAVLSEPAFVSRIAARNVLGGVFGAVLQVLAGFFLPSAVMLAATLAVGRILAALVTVLGSVDRRIPSAQSVRITRTVPLRQAVKNVAAGSLGSLTTQLPVIVAQPALGAAAAGYLALGQRVAAAPLSLVGQGLLQSFMVRAGTLVRERRPGLRSLMVHHSRRLIPIGLLLAAILIVVGLTMFEWIFGPGWDVAGKCLAILAPAFALQLAASPIVGVFPLVGQGGTLLWIEAGKLLVVMTACWAGAMLGGIFGLTIGAAAAILLGHIVTFAAALIVGARWDRTVM